MALSRNEKQWMEACTKLAPIFSTCSKRQYCAVIIATNKRVAGFGYNGSPASMPHCSDGACPRLFDNSPNGSTYDNCISQHAEAGALLWSDQSMRIGGTIIVNGPPCMGCAKLIASSGLKKLVCSVDDDYNQWPEVKNFLVSAGIEVEEYENNN